MSEFKLDTLSETFYLDVYSNLSKRIILIQDRYIKSRIKYIWRLPLLSRIAASKIILMFSNPEVNIASISEDGRYKIAYSQKVAIVGRSELWALLILKRSE